MAIEKYIIDKSDLTALLKGEDLAIQPKGNIKGFCVEIAGNLTNGDVIKAVFPNASIHYHKADELVDDYVSVNIIGCDIQQDYSAEWWNAPYKVDKGDKELKESKE